MHYCDARRLDLKEEHALLTAAQAGDDQAWDELIINNIPFVVKRAAAMSPHYTWLTTRDLVGAGVLGLYRAIPKYDLKTTVPFIAFARWDILALMQDEVAYSQLYRLPKWAYWPCRDNVSEKTKKAIQHYCKMQELDVIDDLGYWGTRTDVTDHKRQQTIDTVRRAVSELPGRERLVVEGVLAGYKLREIGDQLGIPKSTVALIYKHAKKRLRIELDDTN